MSGMKFYLRQLSVYWFVGLFVCSTMTFSQSAKKYWVYFVDKGPSVPSSGVLSKTTSAYAQALHTISPRALVRRAKVLPPDALVDAADSPLYQPYLEKIATSGAVLQQQSKWMNAASYRLTPEQRSIIQQYAFVKSTVPVVVFSGARKEQTSEQRLSSLFKTSSLNYGPSVTQLQVINVPQLHDLGITGHDVLVGMLDSGFRWRSHESLNTRHVIAEHDFIFNDDTTANQPGDASNQDQHGTLTMSTLGGYMPGQLIGPAFNADFVLAKTEYIPTETKTEEDNWQAAIEWMESLGVDVASSSLGYNDFDPQGPSTGDYTWAHGDFNGRTTITALAAVRAARLGVVVCDAMGNEGNGDGVAGTMLTPADADSIISVGAVSSSKLLAGFSSTGPTNDNRTKPDVAAPGVSVYCALVGGLSSYFYVDGTSLATPLTAGSAALIVSARPELTPIQVRNALRNSAEPLTDATRFPSSPNNFTGWGLINAFSAALSFGPVFSNSPAISVAETTSVVAINVASKFGIMEHRVLLHYAIGSSNAYDSIPMLFDSSMFFVTSGRYKITLPYETLGTLVKFYVTATDSSSNNYQSPPAVNGKVWQLYYGLTEVKPVSLLPKEFTLYQNYPNPFNPSTKITYDLTRREHVSITVYDILGRLVATLVDEVQDAGTASSRPPVTFTAENLPSGVYFYRITTPLFTSTRKMMLIR
jgi:subtilisin family serine protease